MVSKRRKSSGINAILQRKLGCSLDIKEGDGKNSGDSSEEEYEKPEPVRHPPPAWLLTKRDQPKAIFKKNFEALNFKAK